LGIPSGTLFDKIAKDPMLTSAFSLGEQDHHNDRLKDKRKTFTYLAPSNEAWEDLRRRHATAHKQLFMGRFWYTTTMLLERHLKVGEGLSAEELVRRTEENEGRGVQFLRGAPLAFVRDLTDDGGEQTITLWPR